MRNILVTVVMLVCLHAGPSHLRAQSERIVGFQPKSFALTNAKLVTGSGAVIPRGNVIVRDGLIVAIGPKVPVPPDAEVIDGKGLVAYPGFINAATSDLLDAKKPAVPEKGRTVSFRRDVLAATRPDNRRGLTPEYRAAVGLGLTSVKLAALRQSGFTDAHVVPSGRIASGVGVLATTGGGPVRESVLIDATLSQFQLFAYHGRGHTGYAYPATLMGATAHLRQAFLDARRDAIWHRLFRNKTPNVPRPPTDPALAALHRVQTGHRSVLFLADSRDDINRALDFAAEERLRPVLWGSQEAYRCLDRLKKLHVSVIAQLNFGKEPKIVKLKSTTKLLADVKNPLRVQEDRRNQWRRHVGGLAALHRAGIRFAFSTRGLKKPSELLPAVRQAIKQGLPRDAALRALTRDAAALLGIEDRLGTLAAGKLGHVVVMTGPFDDPRSKVRYLFVDGHKFEYNPKAKLLSAEPVKAGKPVTAQLSGEWTVTIETAGGAAPATMRLTQTGHRLTGTFSSANGNGTLSTGTVTGRTAEFTVSIGAGAQAVRLRFSAEIDGKKLAGKLTPPFGKVTHWSARRVKSALPQTPNPVQLQPPGTESASTAHRKHATGTKHKPVAAHRPKASPRATSSSAKPVALWKPQPGVLPTELESDRLRRPIQTGGNVLIRGGTVLTGTGRTLPNTSILVRNGRIAAIGRKLKAPKGFTVIDATGRFIMPGIIDTHSHIMITQGINEATQSIVPEVRIKDCVNTADVSEYRALAGGVTTARLLHGSANVIGGQDAVVKLKYGTPAAEQILHNAPQGVKFALGENVKYRRDRFPNTRLGVEATLKRAFAEADDYHRRWKQYRTAIRKQAKQKDRNKKRTALLPPRRDLRLEALDDILHHRKFIHSHCYRADEILMLLRVASQRGIRVWSLQHVLEGYKIAPEIAASKAACSTFADWWAYKVEAYDAIPQNAALLDEAGVNVSIKSDDWELIRHLYLEAAKTVRYGNMPPDHALRTITLNPARQLGLDKRIGSIEVGKDADLAIFNGHPLNGFSRCEMTLIDGEVYFSRAYVPSAMSAAAVRRSAHPRPLVFTPPKVRARRIDWKRSADGRYAIVGARLYPVDRPVIPRGTLLIENGRIAAIGAQVKVPTGTKVIDGTGLHVTPGFIDAGTTLGLTEIGKVRETHDTRESGLFQPDVRAGVGINRDSELIPVARAGGITTILSQPTGGIITGQASIIRLAGWTAPEMVVRLEAGLRINWPGNKKQAGQLRDFLKRTREYDHLRTRAEKSKQTGPISDPRLEAVRPYLHRRKPILIEAHSRKAIAEALLFAEKEKLKIIITGGTDAWKLAGELKKRNVPVIVGPVMRRPEAAYDPFDAPYANPGRLYEAGVRFCIRSDNASNSRNAPFEAAMAVAYGLPEAAGLRAVTLSAAEILGIDKPVGSLTVGKRANIVIADGHPLLQTSQIKGVFIDGRPYPPRSRQTRFYHEYRRRLHEVQKSRGRVARRRK